MEIADVGELQKFTIRQVLPQTGDNVNDVMITGHAHLHQRCCKQIIACQHGYLIIENGINGELLRFESGGKIFRIDRNFDRYKKNAELICEDDGEQLSVADGDLEMLLGGLKAASYENTISVGQMKVETGQALEAEFKNYATNYYTTGNNEIDLAETLGCLREKKKMLEREVKESLVSQLIQFYECCPIVVQQN